MTKRLGTAAYPLSYKDDIIYELHVRTFKDSNPDGIGDFPSRIVLLLASTCRKRQVPFRS